MRKLRVVQFDGKIWKDVARFEAIWVAAPEGPAIILEPGPKGIRISGLAGSKLTIEVLQDGNIEVTTK